MPANIGLTIVFLVFSTLLHAQERNLVDGPAEPIGGISRLTSRYPRSMFTEGQLKRLETAEITLTYKVDSKGHAVIESILGIRDDGILKKLLDQSKNLPEFYPRIENGVPVNSIYSIILTFPKQEKTTYVDGFEPARTTNKAVQANDQKMGEHFEALFAGVFNVYSGSANDYLQAGGGFKIDLMYSSPKFNIGGVINFYANSLKQNYPINTNRPQNTPVPTLMLGLALGRTFYKEERTEFSLQIELAYAMHNVTSPQFDGDSYVQFTGFSPGIAGHYLIQLGEQRRLPSGMEMTSYLNLHAALRPLYFNSKEASGLLIELGVGYRLKTH